MKSYPPERSGITLLNAPEGSPEVHVSLIRSEGFKFLAGINHNTPFVFMHDINTMYGMLIACKELHWPDQAIFFNESLKSSYET